MTPIALAEVSGMAAVTAAMADVFTLVGTVITSITGQPVLLFCLAASLVPIGIGIFNKLRTK
ncbi:MAG: hypothetical protein RSD23_08450 [Ruthenibacterium sp.]